MSSSPLPPSLGALGALGDGERAVLECLAAELNTSPEAVDLNKSLLQCGMGSLQAVRAATALQEVLGQPVDLTVLLQPMPVHELLSVIAGGGGIVATVPPLNIPENIPTTLSNNQEQMLLLQTLKPKSSAYNVVGLLRLDGDLKLDALQQAFDYMCRRHTVLRMTYSGDGGVEEAKQVLTPVDKFKVPMKLLDGTKPLPSKELSESCPFSEEGLTSEHMRALFKEANRVFDIMKGPMIRTMVLKTAPDSHMLLLTMHHAVCDGWSMTLMMSEAVTSYNAFLSGSEPWLDPLSIQYSDYAMWHDTHLRESGKMEREIEYWRKNLAGIPPILELPIDKRRPSQPSGRGGRVPFSVPSDIVVELRRLGMECNATLFMVMLAGFKVVLARQAGMDDIVVGTPSAGRAQSELQELIGFFVNTLVLRTDLSGNPDFRTLIGRVKDTSLGAYANQSVQFHKIVEKLSGIERSVAYNPIFQVMFILQDSNLLNAMEMEGLNTVDWRRDFWLGQTKFDISVEMIEDLEGNIEGHLEFNEDLWYLESAARLANQFVTLLSAVIESPDTEINSLPLLTPGEVKYLTYELPAAPKMEVPDICAHHLLERFAAETPSAPMLWFEGTVLTYAQVNSKANRIANRLRQAGVGLDVPVGVLMERSLDTIVCYLAAMKAGGGYVPLDPEYPAERLAMMMEDSLAPVMLCHSDMLDKVLPELPCKVLLVDKEWDKEFASMPDTNPLVPGLTNRHLSYMIFTSGSTGRPKGTMLAHRGLINLVTWASKRYSLKATDRCLTKAPFAFDMSVQEIFMPFAVGGSLVISKPEGHRDSLYLKQTIEKAGVTFCRYVPSPLDLFLEELEVGECKTLTRVIVGGELMKPELTAKFRSKLPHATLINQYGPTEATVGCCSKTFEPAYAKEFPQFISYPIGRPVDNMRLYVLDELLKPVPIGVPGELHICGPQLAIGYKGKPEVTAEKFIPNPYSEGDEDYARMYKSGDMVRWHTSGDIQYVGRNDQQVKIRGFRIELGEVESAVSAIPPVSAAVAIVEKDKNGQGRLVCFITPETVDVEALETTLKQKLPEHMVPQMIVPLAEMPTLPNGKINRRGFPAVDWSKGKNTGEYCPPSTELEKEIQKVWMEVLTLDDPISILDDFFDLGGTSLLAGRVNGILRKNLGVQIDGNIIFKEPTIIGMAKGIVAEHGDVMSGPDEGLVKRLKSTKHTMTEKLEDGIPSRSNTLFALSLTWISIALVNLFTFYGMALALILALFIYTWYPSATGYEAILAAPAIILAVFVYLAIGSVIWKWVVIGKYKPGTHSVWGIFYMRWLAVRMFQVDLVLIFLPFLRGSEAYNWYLRMMGAKIGRNCVIETIFISDFDLVDIGDDVAIERDAVITPYALNAPAIRFGASKLTLKPLRIGDGATIAARAMVVGGTTVPPGTVLLPMTSSAVAKNMVNDVPHEQYRTVQHPIGTIWGFLSMVICLLLTLTSLIPVFLAEGFIVRAYILEDQATGVPQNLYLFIKTTLQCIWNVNGHAEISLAIPCEDAGACARFGVPTGTIINTPPTHSLCITTFDRIATLVVLFPWLIVIVAPLSMFLVVIASKWMIVGRFAPGCRDRLLWDKRVHVYKRLMDSPLFQLGARVWSGTFVIKFLYQALGATVGSNAWISFVTILETDLLIVGNDVSIGGNGYICCSTLETTEAVTIESDSDMTNSVTVYPGVTVQERGLLGDYTVALTGSFYQYGKQVQGDLVIKKGTELKPPDEDNKPPPTYNLFYHLCMFLSIVICLPSLLFSFIVPLVMLMTRFMIEFGFLAGLGFFPIALTVAYMAMITMAIVAKLIVKPIHKEDAKFYTFGHFRWELLRIMLTTLVPLLERLRGTSIIVWLYRGLGAKLGKDVCWMGGDRVEMDILMVGDFSVLNEFTVMDGHSIEAKVLKHLPTALAPYTTFGNRCSLLMGSSTEAFATLCELSLAMKGETLSRRTVWRGVPAAPKDYNFDPSIEVEILQEIKATAATASFMVTHAAPNAEFPHGSFALTGPGSFALGPSALAAKSNAGSHALARSQLAARSQYAERSMLAAKSKISRWDSSAALRQPSHLMPSQLSTVGITFDSKVPTFAGIAEAPTAPAVLASGVWPAGEANRCMQEHFFHHGLADPSRQAVVWLGDKGQEAGVRTYGDLAARARAVAFCLVGKYGVKPGDRVVLVLPPGLVFIDAFLGCLVAGAVAVPVYPPNPATLEKDLERLNKVVKVANVKVALTTGEFRTRLYLAKTAMMFSKTFNAVWPKDLTWQTLDGLGPAPKTFNPTPSSGDDVAFLQFTSGSTSDPKGVMITHNNVLHNINCMFQLQPAYQELGSIVCVNWMPQYHDMGLINMCMATLFNGGTLYNMSPLTFLKSPLLWLEAMSRYKANLSGGPNFSLVRVSKAINALPADKRPAFDLSSMSTLVCGAEPINITTLDDFIAVCGPLGFPKLALWPAYGLAEHTVFACAVKEDYFADDLGNVCCGTPLPDVHYRIVEPESCVEVPSEGTVGEIWISSPSKAFGYWGQEEVTKETFHAKLKGVSSPLEFLRTGDLGYMRNGQLFVKGRCKDVIIVAGRNYYPNDVELSVQECSEAIRPGCIAAFTLPYGDDKNEVEGFMGIIAEVREPKMSAIQISEVIRSIRDAVQQGHAPLQLVTIILVQPRTIPKTTSGKIRRAECKIRAISGSGLSVVPNGTWNHTPGEANP